MGQRDWVGSHAYSLERLSTLYERRNSLWASSGLSIHLCEATVDGLAQLQYEASGLGDLYGDSSPAFLQLLKEDE